MCLPSVTPVFECEGGIQQEGQWLEPSEPILVSDPQTPLLIPRNPCIMQAQRRAGQHEWAVKQDGPQPEQAPTMQHTLVGRELHCATTGKSH